jgi:hypothetical protein
MKPTQILAKLCKDGKIDGPTYSNGKVRVGRQTFFLQADDSDCNLNTKGKPMLNIFTFLQYLFDSEQCKSNILLQKVIICLKWMP